MLFGERLKLSVCRQVSFSFLTFPGGSYNPGQNVLGHVRKLDTKTHFAKLTHILPLKKAWGCCYKGLFLLSPSPPSSVDCVELKLECITSTLHRGERGERRCLNFTSYWVSVPRVLTMVVGFLLQGGGGGADIIASAKGTSLLGGSGGVLPQKVFKF